LYYLQSRYYDVVVGRFINADDPICIAYYEIALSYALFGYCDNPPHN
jgi:RHS repeat-associated protein